VCLCIIIIGAVLWSACLPASFSVLVLFLARVLTVSPPFPLAGTRERDLAALGGISRDLADLAPLSQTSQPSSRPRTPLGEPGPLPLPLSKCPTPTPTVPDSGSFVS
jgi:hypothetical protein